MSFASVFSRFRPALMLGMVALLPATLGAQSAGSLDPSFRSPLLGSTVFAVATETALSTEYIAQGGDEAGLYITDAAGVIAKTYTFPFFGNEGRIIYSIVPETVLDPGASTYKLLLGGMFGQTETSGNNLPAKNIARIDAVSGIIDPTFDVGFGANDFVTSILPLSDGTTLVGGLFTRFNKISYPRLVLLGRTGFIDTNFKPVPIPDGVFAIAPETDPATGAFDNKVIVGGTFSTIGNSNYTKLARIDLAGNVDPTFKPVIDSRVLAVATQPDGKVVIGGEFATINGQIVGHIARLNPDGSLDTTFHASVGVLPEGTSAPVAVYLLKLLPDGRLYVGGQFSAVDGVKRHYLARIESDGSLDTSFDPGDLITNSVQSVAVQNDFRLLVGETLSKKVVDGPFPPSLIRLYGGTAPTATAVSLAATKTQARFNPDGTRNNGVFVLRRSGDLSQSLTVNIEVTGTARSGVAFKALKASQIADNIYRLTIPANLTKLKLKVKPLKLDATDAPETVRVTLVPSQDGSDPYQTGVLTDGVLSGAPAAGTVAISNTP